METVLIVEDNLAYLRQLTESLSGFRDAFDLVTAENGQEAINLLDQSKVDIVVTDLNMPIMDGFALLTHLREVHPFMPAVVLTGLTRPDVFERLKLYGDLKVLQKPVTPEAFVGTLRTVLETAQKTKPKGVTLPNLLQILTLDRRTCSLLVEAAGRRGSLHFVSGELYDAFIFDEQLDGEAAAAELLRWTEAKIELKNVSDDETPRERFVKTSLEDLLAAAYPNLEAATLPQVQIVQAQADEITIDETVVTDADDSNKPLATNEPSQAEKTKAKKLNLEDHVVASTDQTEVQKTQSERLAEEASMAELRQQLETEAETLQETFQRLQQRAQEADEALTAALSEFETFREQQRSYLAAEEAYQVKRKNLEQWREGAEDLAKKLLSAVQQVDEDEGITTDKASDSDDAKTDDEKQLA